MYRYLRMPKTAVVLAGGKGTRLRPLTYTTPKPLIPVGNIPLLEYILKLLTYTNVERVIVIVKYLGDLIKKFIYEIRDDFSFEIKIPNIDPLDTADAVRKVSYYINDDFYVIMGDVLTNMDLKNMGSFHSKHNGIATIALKEVENPLEFGVVLVDELSRIKLFLEKPRSIELYFMRMLYSRARIKHFYENLVNTGFYIFNYKILDILEENPDLMDWGRHVFPFLIENGYEIFGWNVGESYWADIGRPRSYLHATYDLLDKHVYPLMPKGEYLDGVWIERPVDFSKNASFIPPVVIGKFTSIERDAVIGPYTVLGLNNKVEAGTQIMGSILWNNVEVGEKTIISKSIIGSHVRIGRDVKVKEYSVVGDYCSIEDKSIIKKNTLLKPYTIFRGARQLKVKVSE
ncbi:MAG: NDP-sugar synthase [Thermoprotei archaeon]|nr:MAG: NDP-sugar synthase [Thermoprotei archaeon]